MGKSNTVKQFSLFEPIKEQVNTVKGNTKLIDYGIQTETSDYRVHVGYSSQHIFVFPTKIGKSLYAEIITSQRLQLKRIPSFDRYGNRIVTATGYAVPISDFNKLQEILIPVDIYHKYHILYKGESTTASGQKAVCIVKEMLLKHLIVLPIEVHDVTEKTLQIEGNDIIVKMNLRLQIKSDYLAGRREHGGKGNIFLQDKECNPFRRF